MLRLDCVAPGAITIDTGVSSTRMLGAVRELPLCRVDLKSEVHCLDWWHMPNEKCWDAIKPTRGSGLHVHVESTQSLEMKTHVV